MQRLVLAGLCAADWEQTMKNGDDYNVTMVSTSWSLVAMCWGDLV